MIPHVSRIRSTWSQRCPAHDSVSVLEREREREREREPRVLVGGQPHRKTKNSKDSKDLLKRSAPLKNQEFQGFQEFQESQGCLKRSAPPPLRKSLGFGDFGVFGNLWRSGFSVGLPKITKLPTITEIPKVLKRPGPPKSREPGLTSSKTFGIFVVFGICDLFNCLASGGAGLFEKIFGICWIVIFLLYFGMVWLFGGADPKLKKSQIYQNHNHPKGFWRGQAHRNVGNPVAPLQNSLGCLWFFEFVIFGILWLLVGLTSSKIFEFWILGIVGILGWSRPAWDARAVRPTRRTPKKSRTQIPGGGLRPGRRM